MARPEKSKKIAEETDISAPAIEQPESASTAAENSPTIEQIQQRAYEIYLERGGADGNDTDDWLRAERELRGETDEISQ